MLTDSTNLLGPLFRGREARRVFSSSHQLALMVRFEVALAHALEVAGIAPAGTAADCRRGAVEFVTTEHQQSIGMAAVDSGNIAIPFVKLLTSHVRRRVGPAADFIHYGATSQDLLDTVLVLQLREFSLALDRIMREMILNLIALTRGHQDILLAGRTWMQQGPPTSFALKTAQWLSGILRHQERLASVNSRATVLQFGGAVGTLASLGSEGIRVSAELARELQLTDPDLPWHSQRDLIVEFATALALLAGSLGKIARDLSLMVQTETGEVTLPAGEGAGGSSTMPHKRNPVPLAVVLAAAVRAPGLACTMLSAMVQEHERGLGGWHAEWETLPELCRITEGALQATADSLKSLHPNPDAMRRNMDLLHGVAMAEAVSMRLSASVGRPAAHALLERASRRALERGTALLDIFGEDSEITAHLSLETLREVLDPANYLGSAATFVERVLASAQKSLLKETTDAAR